MFFVIFFVLVYILQLQKHKSTFWLVLYLFPVLHSLYAFLLIKLLHFSSIIFFCVLIYFCAHTFYSFLKVRHEYYLYHIWHAWYIITFIFIIINKLYCWFMVFCKGYDISFLITNYHCEDMQKHKLMDFIVQFMEVSIFQGFT